MMNFLKRVLRGLIVTPLLLILTPGPGAAQTTPGIPSGLVTPDRIETRIGTV